MEEQQIQLDPDIIAAQVKKDLPVNADAIAAQVKRDVPTTPPSTPPTSAPTMTGAGVLASAFPNYAAVGDVAKGGLKGLLSTIQSGGNLVRSLTGMGGPSVSVPVSTDPTNPAQQVGKGLEQAAEYAVPGSAVESATAKLPLLARMVAQAGAGGTVAALQGKTPQETGVAAGVSAVSPVVGAAWPAVKDFVASKVTPRMMNALMEVSPKWLEYGQNPGGRVLDEGIVAASKDGLKTQLTAKTQDAGRALEAYLIKNGQGVTIDAQPLVLNALVNAEKRIGMGSDQAFQNKLFGIMSDIQKQFGNLNSLSPLQAQRLKTAIGDSVRWHGTPYEGDINQALVEMYGDIKSAINQAVPGVKALNERYGELKIAQNAVGDSINKDMTRGLSSMLTTVPTPAATVVGQLQRIMMNPASNTASTALGRMGLGGVLSQQGQQ